MQHSSCPQIFFSASVFAILSDVRGPLKPYLTAQSYIAAQVSSWGNCNHCNKLDNCVLQIHVILFGIGEGEPEGIYSVCAMPGADQLPQETIIAFEDAEDAQRYASRLEATMERAPNVVPITPSELLEFCKESGYNCRLEQGGSMLSPPDFNVDITDWERSLRLRCVSDCCISKPVFVGLALFDSMCTAGHAEYCAIAFG